MELGVLCCNDVGIFFVSGIFTCHLDLCGCEGRKEKRQSHLGG